MDPALLKIMELKAYKEWQASLSAFNGLRFRITKNRKGKLAKELLAASKEWDTYDQFKRVEILSTILHECAHLYDVPATLLFTRNSWKQQRISEAQTDQIDASVIEEEFSDEISGMSLGFYSYQKGRNIIVINSVEYLETAGFYDLVDLLAHEVGHAVYYQRGREFRERIDQLEGQGQDQWKYANAHEMDDPLFTVCALIILGGEEERSQEARTILEKSGGYSVPEYYDVLHERLAQDFADACVTCLKKSILALETDGSDGAYANIAITTAQNIHKNLQKFTNDIGKELYIPNSNRIEEIVECRKAQDLLDEPRYDALMDYLDGIISHYYPFEAELDVKTFKKMPSYGLTINRDIAIIHSLINDVRDMVEPEAA